MMYSLKCVKNCWTGGTGVILDPKNQPNGPNCEVNLNSEGEEGGGGCTKTKGDPLGDLSSFHVGRRSATEEISHDGMTGSGQIK